MLSAISSLASSSIIFSLKTQTLETTSFIYSPIVFNKMLVFATTQTISASTCNINGTTYTITSENETLNSTTLKWGYVNLKSDSLFTINSTYNIYIVFSNNTAYSGSLTDDVLNCEVCMDETTYNSSSRQWSSKVNSNYNVTLTSASSIATSTANSNNTSLSFQNVKISGANTILTKQINGTIGSNWAFFCVAQNTGTNGHLLANDTVTATTSNFYTFGVWQAISNSMWWSNNWFSTVSSNTTRAVNWNVFSFFKDTSNSNAGTYYVNRNNTNLITNSTFITNNPNWPNYNIGHDIQVVSTLSSVNGTVVNIAFICLYKTNKTNAQARCIEYCLFKQYGLISRY